MINRHDSFVIKLSSNSFFVLFVLMVWGRQIIGETARAVFMRIPILQINDGHTAIILIYTVVLLFSLEYIIKNLQLSDLVIAILILTIYFLSVLMFPENAELVLQNALEFMTIVFPMYFLGKLINIDCVFNKLCIVSAASLIVSVVLSILWTTDAYEVSGNMSLAYNILPHLCLMLVYSIKKINIVKLIILIISIITFILQGNRGAIVCFAIFCVLYIIFNLELKKKTAILISCSIIFAIFIINISYVDALSWLADISEDLGLSTRVINNILNGDFFKSSSRDAIYEQLWNAIMKSPVFGHGIFGDRILVGTYSHNFVIELLVEFGFVGGIPIIISVFYTVLSGIFRAKGHDTKAFMLLLSCSVIGYLMFSGSYLSHGLFFLLMGLSVRINRYKNLRIINSI